MEGRRRDLRDRNPRAWRAGDFDVIVNDTCARHVRMNDVDHGHHSWFIVWRVMLCVVTYLYIRPDR
ncbi:MAG: hypothetical protein ACRDSF_05775 [Pseudonocardiaceae bacterium]